MPPPKLNPLPPTTIQINHYHSPPLKIKLALPSTTQNIPINTHHHPKYIHNHPPPPKSKSRNMLKLPTIQKNTDNQQKKAYHHPPPSTSIQNKPPTTNHLQKYTHHHPQPSKIYSLPYNIYRPLNATTKNIPTTIQNIPTITHHRPKYAENYTKNQSVLFIGFIIYHRDYQLKNLLNVEYRQRNKNDSLSSFFFNDINCIHKETKEKLKVK